MRDNTSNSHKELQSIISDLATGNYQHSEIHGEEKILEKIFSPDKRTKAL